MSDIVKRHNFDQALSKIQKFANNTPTIPVISKFEVDGGLFGWGDHYINGVEMNRYVETVQDIFRSQNNIIVKTIQEFRDVYKTFDYLDKEYLQGILGAVNAATMASQGAKTASDQAKEAAHRALNNERDIKAEVENLRKVVEKIKTIKEDLTSKISSLETQIQLSSKTNELSGVIETKEKNARMQMIEQEATLNLVIESMKSEMHEQNRSLKRQLIISYIIGGIGIIAATIALL